MGIRSLWGAFWDTNSTSPVFQLLPTPLSPQPPTLFPRSRAAPKITVLALPVLLAALRCLRAPLPSFFTSVSAQQPQSRSESPHFAAPAAKPGLSSQHSWQLAHTSVPSSPGHSLRSVLAPHKSWLLPIPPGGVNAAGELPLLSADL